MVWHFEISTYEIHSHGKNYQHFKKKQQTLYYATYEKKIIIIFSTKFTLPI